MKKQTVYLAGGFRSDWATKVANSSAGFHFINPKLKEFKNNERVIMDVNEYGSWDLHFIRKSDIVFVYVERDNTSCIGLSCEAGYAKGLGKTVITVLEKNHETILDKHLQFITQVSDITFDNLLEGIEYLKSFAI